MELLEPEEVLASSRLDLERQQRLVAQWQRPHVNEEEAAEMCGLPASSWAMLKARNLTPPPFKLGRRLFHLTADLRAWLEREAKGAKSK